MEQTDPPAKVASNDQLGPNDPERARRGLQALRVVLGIDSPETRGWAPAVQQEARRAIDRALSVLGGAKPARQPDVVGLMKLVNQLRCLDAPRPETASQSDRLFDEIERRAYALAGVAVPSTDHSARAVRNSERGG